LQNAVAFHDQLALGVVDGAVERMRHRGGQLPRGVARKLRVRVQRDDVLNVRQQRKVARDVRKTFRAPTAQTTIQGGEFATLAFVSHPDALLFVPQTWPVKEVENAGPIALVFLVERLNAVHHTNERVLHRRAFVSAGRRENR
jgi:hypothetical protein